MGLHARVETSTSSNGGFTLVEVMVAIVITLVGLLGLLEAATLATKQNLKNQMREEAVLLGEEVVRNTQKKSFVAVSSVTRIYPTKIRGLSRNYNATTTVESLSTTSKKFTVNVSWTTGYETASHEVVSLVTN